MSGAQALLSNPLPQPQVSARDFGAATQQDPAVAEAAGAAFNDALGDVDQPKARMSSAGSGEQDESDEGAVAQTTIPSQVGGGLQAALAAIGLPWAINGPAQSAVSEQPRDASQSAAVDPLSLLARALAANDTEPDVPASPVAGEAQSQETIDVRILARERYLGVEDAVSAQAALTAVQTSGSAVPQAGARDYSNVQGLAPVEIQAQPAADAAAVQVQRDANGTAAAAVQVAAVAASKSDPGRVANDDNVTSDVVSSNSQETDAADPREAALSDVAAPELRVSAKKQGEHASLDGSRAEIRDGANIEADVPSDTSADPDFSTVMTKATGPVMQMPTQSAGDVSAASSPATQIMDQLTAPAAREVISDVKTSGDTKVIELQLKPEHLGSVTVRVSLKDDVISLKLEAQRADTAQEIGREVAKLASSLKEAGYVVDSITTQQMDLRTVSRIEGAASSGASGGSTQGQAQSSGQGQSFQGSGTGAQQNGNGRGGSSGFDPWSSGSNNDGQNNGLAPERQSGLYV